MDAGLNSPELSKQIVCNFVVGGEVDLIRSGIVAVLALVLLSACATTPMAGDTSQNKSNKVVSPASDASAEASGADANDSHTPRISPSNLIAEYRIGVDDVVQISVWRNENLSVTVPVRPDGMISIPLAGDVLAGGLTPVEVSKSLSKKLSKFIRDPQVTVILTQLKSHEYLSRVRVTGAVRNPISVSYRQGMTVLDVVLSAGGVTEFASPNSARLYRKEGNKTKSYRVRLGDILSRGKLKTNINLQPGDIITIPERLF